MKLSTTVLLPLNVVTTSERFPSPIKGPQSRSQQTLHPTSHPIPLLSILASLSLSTTPYYLACFLSLFHDAALHRSPRRPRPHLFDDRIACRRHPRRQQTKR